MAKLKLREFHHPSVFWAFIPNLAFAVCVGLLGFPLAWIAEVQGREMHRDPIFVTFGVAAAYYGFLGLTAITGDVFWWNRGLHQRLDRALTKLRKNQDD